MVDISRPILSDETHERLRYAPDAVAAGLATSAALTRPAAAQPFADTMNAVCGTAAGGLLATGIALVCFFLFVKGLFNVLMGLDMSKSSSSKQQRGGQNKMVSGAVMVVGSVAGPGVIAALLSANGVGTGCIIPGTTTAVRATALLAGVPV